MAYEFDPVDLGRVIDDWLQRNQLTQDEFAELIDVSRYSINQLVNNRRSITADMAIRLGAATKTDPRWWLAQQNEIDLYRAHQRMLKNGMLSDE